MPRIIPLRLAAVCALVLSLTFAFTALAAAKAPLAEKPVPMSSTAVKTSPKATCFGPGSGGSGEDAQLKGNTAMGLLASGAKTIAALRPLLISDSFDFGLALCGVGSSVAKGKASWYLKVNHESLEVSGDAAKIKPRDEVLWTLAPSYPYPDELVRDAPDTARAGMSFTVRVWAYDEKGRKKPQAGAKVTGAAAP